VVSYIIFNFLGDDPYLILFLFRNNEAYESLSPFFSETYQSLTPLQQIFYYPTFRYKAHFLLIFFSAFCIINCKVLQKFSIRQERIILNRE